MVSIEKFRGLVLSFPEATEQPHFEKTSFRINKKIFATLDVPKRQACIKLSEIEQDVFSLADNTIIFPVPNKWGKQGWTLINLDKVHEDLLADALMVSFCHVAPKKLAGQVRPTTGNN
ncbi:MAG: MmcQ/YjbR family DNA-binding protein [Mucilaginibacter sp.]